MPKKQETKAPVKEVKVVKAKKAFDAEKFESESLPVIATLARTRGEDQPAEFQGQSVTVHQDGTYTVGE